jgi:hypothetical protein
MGDGKRIGGFRCMTAAEKDFPRAAIRAELPAALFSIRRDECSFLISI